MTNQAKANKALQLLTELIQDLVKAMGSHGAPSGHVYAALMAHGCTLNQYNQIIGLMVKLGMIQKRGNVLFAS